MDYEILPKSTKTWDQFRRICAHRLFAQSANHQAFLRHIIELLYAGKDEFAAKVISVDLFGRDTSIAKVEGRSVREKLADYYRSDGRDDPIVIEIPSQTFKPKIYNSKLSSPALLSISKANELMDMTTKANLAAALKEVERALLIEPQHPKLLGFKAYIHVLRSMFGEWPPSELQFAEELVHELAIRNRMGCESTLASAYLYASRFDWTMADKVFLEAFALPHSEDFVPASSPLHISYLCSQRRFVEAAEILHSKSKQPSSHDPDVILVAELAMVYVMAGDIARAGELVKVTIARCRTRHNYKPLFPVHSIIEGENNDYAESIETLTEVLEQDILSRVGVVSFGLLGLFCGLSGHLTNAGVMYSTLLEIRSERASEAATDTDAAPVLAMDLAIAALGTQQEEECVKLLEIAINNREPLTLCMHLLPFLKPLHENAGFRRLVIDKMHLCFE